MLIVVGFWLLLVGWPLVVGWLVCSVDRWLIGWLVVGLLFVGWLLVGW